MDRVQRQSQQPVNLNSSETTSASKKKFLKTSDQELSRIGNKQANDAELEAVARQQEAELGGQGWDPKLLKRLAVFTVALARDEAKIEYAAQSKALPPDEQTAKIETASDRHKAIMRKLVKIVDDSIKTLSAKNKDKLSSLLNKQLDKTRESISGSINFIQNNRRSAEILQKAKDELEALYLER